MMTRSTYSVKLRAALDALKPAFRDLGSGFEQLTQKRAAIAPAFMKAAEIWKRETRKPFVSFVRELDPRVPVQAKAYKAHPAYQAALYLQQLARKPEQRKPQGMSPLAMLATTIKSFLPLYSQQHEQRAALDVLLAATKWRARDQARLLSLIKQARPVPLPKVPRLVETKISQLLTAAERDRERKAS